MNSCRVCNQKFNVGFTPASGPICIQCANVEGNMLKQDQWLLDDFKLRFNSHNARMEPANLLASKLLKSMLLSIFGPILAIFLIGIVSFIFYLLGVPTIGRIVFSVGAVITILVGWGLSLNWLSVMNDALVANNEKHVVRHVLLSFFIPLYALILTIIIRLKLVHKGNATVWYGRLNIV